jgi:1-deoxy-D-xylulose-5-phosphate synthase
MATQGLIPYCNIYSTFLQRAYDQVIHDVALQNLPVIFCLDRAGLVGEDGATHHGVFDLAYLRSIPNLIVFAPSTEIELRNILYTAQLGLKSPIAIRYPRGTGAIIDWQKPFKEIEIGKGVALKKGNKIAILSIGTIARNVSTAINLMKDPSEIAHFDMRFVKPLDTALLHQIFKSHTTIFTVEDGIIKGGFGTAVLEFASENEYYNKVRVLGIPDNFITHGSISELQNKIGLDPNSLAVLFSKA